MPILGQPYCSSCKGMNCSSSPRPWPAGLVNSLVHDGLEFPLNPKNMVLPKNTQKSSICTTPCSRQHNVGGEQNKDGYKKKQKNLHLLTQQMNSYHPACVPNNKPHPSTLPLTQSPYLESIFMIHEQNKLMKTAW